ncbi:PBP1 and LysM peptidoglycan-binding domain-containing protein [Tenacibaculum agarivorans]|uniref:PBP1 and LysM peptidoglycan-binding domain-containing protein n=1 Tax=Tenacibaculum agarivorans TaxID=1908389 RepID=UPI00094BA3DD|nr:LysM peptidoglycan-binding domain-containing protein [Tenacibaculum agarivorans]
MNTIKFWAFTIALSLIVASCSQQKRYISYTVKEGETMRDIAKRVNVKTEDLVRLNPDVGDVPSANSTIIIPNPEYNKNIPLIQKPTETTDNGIEATDTELTNDDTTVAPDSTQIVRTVYEYKTHTVKPGETVYRITKTYDISKDELLKLNPQFPRLKDNYLDVGQELKVKVAEKKVFYISREEDLKNHVTHTVESKETVYGLTRFYNISKEELMNLNPEYPEIADNVLKVGQVLRIRDIAEKLDTDEIKMFIDTIATTDTIRLAMLLPFRAKEYDSISYEKIFDAKKSKRSGDANLANLITDFYMGSEIAIDSVKRSGVNVDVSVFDTGNRGNLVEQIIESDKLDNVDAIIGPFYSDKAEYVAKKADAPVVFPHYSKKQDQFSSSSLVKSAPDNNARSQFLANYLTKIYTKENIFIVSDGSTDSDDHAKEITKLLREHDSINEVHVLKPDEGYIKKERFTDKMKEGSHNWVIITSNDKALVANAINSMVVLPEKVSAQVFSINKGAAYDNVDNNTLARVGFAFITDNYTDSEDQNLKEFTKKYRKINKDIPSEYAIRGFDITLDVLMRLASGEELTKTYKQGASIRLGNKFIFDKKLFGSTSNYGLFMVKYNPDLTLERIK